ncbi:MAG: hypothetical protein ACRC1M_05800 [Methanobacteriaceae archaeon]
MNKEDKTYNKYPHTTMLQDCPNQERIVKLETDMSYIKEDKEDQKKINNEISKTLKENTIAITRLVDFMDTQKKSIIDQIKGPAITGIIVGVIVFLLLEGIKIAR